MSFDKLTICDCCGSMQVGRTCLMCVRLSTMPKYNFNTNKQQGERVKARPKQFKRAKNSPHRVHRGLGSSQYFPMMFQTDSKAPRPKSDRPKLSARWRALSKLGEAEGQTHMGDFLSVHKEGY